MNPSYVTLLVFCLLMVLLFIIRHRQIQLSRRKKSLASLDMLVQVMEILKKTQQHRGMHAAVLNGNISFKPQLLPLEQSLAQHYQNIILLEQEYRLSASESVVALAEKWRTQISSPATDSHVSFQQHSLIITQLLDHLWDLADESGLTTHENEQVQQLFGELVKTLPELAELLGQIRAIVVQVASQSQCSPDKKLQLMFTINQIEQRIQGGREEQRGDLQKFVDEIRMAIHQNQLVSLNPEAFFNKATLIMDKVFIQIHQGVDQMRKF